MVRRKGGSQSAGKAQPARSAPTIRIMDIPRSMRKAAAASPMHTAESTTATVSTASATGALPNFRPKKKWPTANMAAICNTPMTSAERILPASNW